MTSMSKSVSVIALTHDLIRKQSIVTMVWDNDPEKRISLPVPFGCDLAQLQRAAEKAMREFAAEAQAIVVKA